MAHEISLNIHLVPEVMVKQCLILNSIRRSFSAIFSVDSFVERSTLEKICICCPMRVFILHLGRVSSAREAN